MNVIVRTGALSQKKCRLTHGKYSIVAKGAERQSTRHDDIGNIESEKSEIGCVEEIVSRTRGADGAQTTREPAPLKRVDALVQVAINRTQRQVWKCSIGRHVCLYKCGTYERIGERWACCGPCTSRMASNIPCLTMTVLGSW